MDVVRLQAAVAVTDGPAIGLQVQTTVASDCMTVKVKRSIKLTKLPAASLLKFSLLFSGKPHMVTEG